MMRIYFALPLLIVFLFAAGCASEKEQIIGGDKDKHGCLIAAGYSWCEEKQKCIRTWEEPCSPDETCGTASGKNMSFDDAKKIALESECSRTGTLKDNHFCNENSGTWWIDLEPNENKSGCNPACVIYADSGVAEINWRCTGLSP